MLPSAVKPSTQAWSLNGDDVPPAGPQPCTYTVYVAAVGLTRFTSSAEVPLPLAPTSVLPRYTYRSKSLPGVTSASNSAKRACVVPAGIVTGIATTPTVSLGLVPADVTAGTGHRSRNSRCTSH